MICLEVVLNGTVHCTAGLDAPSRVTASVSCRTQEDGKLQDVDGASYLAVIGTPLSELNPFPITWQQMNVKPGDEITIRVVERERSDEPFNMLPFGPDEHLEKKRRLYERLKKEFESS